MKMSYKRPMKGSRDSQIVADSAGAVREVLSQVVPFHVCTYPGCEVVISKGVAAVLLEFSSKEPALSC